MAAEPAIAFAAGASEVSPFEVRVNFGIFAGRAATPAEIDDLARRLMPQIGQVSIVSEERHEIGVNVVATLHQVRVEIEADRLPSDPAELDSLKQRMVEQAEAWARECVADRHAPSSEA